MSDIIIRTLAPGPSHRRFTFLTHLFLQTAEVIMKRLKIPGSGSAYTCCKDTMRESRRALQLGQSTGPLVNSPWTGRGLWRDKRRESEEERNQMNEDEALCHRRLVFRS